MPLKRKALTPHVARLDPGINIVVKEITCTLTLGYNVRRAWGVRSSLHPELEACLVYWGVRSGERESQERERVRSERARDIETDRDRDSVSTLPFFGEGRTSRARSPSAIPAAARGAYGHPPFYYSRA